MNETGGRRTWGDESLAFEAWKHCGAVGGSDKDKMIQIVTWLLGFSAAIIGFQATADLTDPRIAIFGILISLVAAYVALLYGTYAAWNWALADEIAETYGWRELLPDHEPRQVSTSGWQRGLVRRLARPCKGKIAPVFWAFLVFSIGSAVIHLLLLWRGA
jgi:hypothetical protein